MNLLRTLAQTSSMTLLSRILGFLRDVVVAHVFGAAGETDAFVVAFRLPNLLRRLFAEGAFSQAFVPLLAARRSHDGDMAACQLVNHVASVLVVALLVTTVLGEWFAPQIVWVTAPGFQRDPHLFALTVQLLRITFPYIFFIALVALCAGILNTWQKFWVPAFTPVWLNVSFLVLVLGFSSWFHPPPEADAQWKCVSWLDILSVPNGGVYRATGQSGHSNMGSRWAKLDTVFLTERYPRPLQWLSAPTEEQTFE